MTVAAGFPIASLIPGGQKAQGQSGTPPASLTQTSTGSERISFRTGLEKLVNADRLNSTDALSSEAASSEAIKDQLTEAAATGALSNAAHAIPSQNHAWQRSISAPRQPQSTQSSSLLPSTANRSSLSGLEAAERANSGPAELLTETAISAAASKSPGSGHSTQSKSAHDSTKASAQTNTSANSSAAQTQLHPSAFNVTAAPTPQFVQVPHTRLDARLDTRPQPSPATFTQASPPSSIATESAQQGNNLSSALAFEEPAHTSTVVSAGNAQALHEAVTTAVTTAESTPQHTNVAQQSDDLTLQSSIKSASEPSISGAAAIAQSAEAAQVRAAFIHGPAARDRGSLQHPASGDISPQASAAASHSALVRDPAGIATLSAERASLSAGSAAAGYAASGSVTTGAGQPQQGASLTVRDTFAALDADPGAPATAWTHAGPRQVEAGFQDPSLGWVSVRADLTPGGLHASVVPNSPEAAQALGGHLSNLNAYLAEHHGTSITASLAAPEDRSSTQQSGMQQSGMDSGTQSSARQQNESTQPAPERLTGQTASSTLSAGIQQQAESTIYTPTHTGRISVLA